MTLTTEDYDLLKRPFTAEAVKFRIDGRPKNGKVRILTYIDSRLAAERLTEVDPSWSGEPSPLGTVSLADSLAAGLPIVYHLTVKGVSRSDVGQIGPASYDDHNGLFKKGDFVADDKHAKMAVSDALKRSAVLFGVGSYLYTLGNVYVDEKKHTTQGGKYLNDAGQKFLKEQYSRFISSEGFRKRFGEPISYGEELANNSGDEVGQADTVPTKNESDSSVPDTGGPADGEVSASAPSGVPSEDPVPPQAGVAAANGDDPYEVVAAGLFKLDGRSEGAGRVWIAARKNKNLAIKRTLKQCAERGHDPETVERLLKENGLQSLLGSFSEALA